MNTATNVVPMPTLIERCQKYLDQAETCETASIAQRMAANRFRLELGKEILAQRVGSKLPNGLLSQLAKQLISPRTGNPIGERAVQHYTQYAEAYGDAAADVLEPILKLSWHETRASTSQTPMPQQTAGAPPHLVGSTPHVHYDPVDRNASQTPPAQPTQQPIGNTPTTPRNRKQPKSPRSSRKTAKAKARAARQPKAKAPTPPNQPKAPTPKTVDMVARLTAAAKKLADGQSHSYDEISKAMGGRCKDAIRRFSMQHWVTIEPSKNGYIFTLDPILSAIHDANPPQLVLGNLSAYTFLKNLRKQIISRRAKDLAELAGKIASGKNTAEQTRATPLVATLNWIEDEFDKIDVSYPAPLYTTLKDLRTEVTRKREEAHTKRNIDLTATASEFSRAHKLNPILDLIENTLAGLDINPLGRD